jgi:hypothetical protein
MAVGCKKVVASGARTIALMMEERCFGYLNAKLSDPTVYLGTWKRMELNSESVINEIGTFQSAALNPERALRRRMQGTSAVGGDLTAELSGNGYMWAIAQAIGKVKGSGVSSDPYTILPVDASGVSSDETAGYQQDSTFYNDTEINYDATASDVASDSAGFECGYYTIDEYAMEPGFTLLVSRDGGTIKNESGQTPTNHLWFKYLGVKINTWAITATATEIATHTFSVLGRSESIVDIAIPSYIERPAVNDPFSGFNGAVSIDDSSECVLTFDMTLNNNLGTDQFCMGDRYRNSLPEGQRLIEGTITIELTSLEFYNKFRNGTAAQLEIEFDLLGDGTETMKVILPKIEFNGTTPTAGGPEVINQELPYTALWSDAAASLLVQSSYAPNGFDLAIEIITAGSPVV